MKKLIWFFVFSLFSTVVLADSPFTTAPAPAQVYHLASDGQSPSSSVPTAQAVTQQMAQLSGSNTQPAALPVAPPPSNNGAALVNSDNTLAFQQKTAQRLQNLEDSNRAMASAILSINQNIAVLQQQVSQLNPPVSSKSHSHPAGLLAWFAQPDADEYLNLIAAAVILMGSGMLIGRLLRRDQPPVVAVKNADDTKAEYDFMGTNEAIPAKLDLARSYMAMENYEDARAELKIVLQKGNEEQRMVAESLIHKINKIKIGA